MQPDVARKTHRENLSLEIIQNARTQLADLLNSECRCVAARDVGRQQPAALVVSFYPAWLSELTSSMWKVCAWFNTTETPGRELSPPTSSQLHQATGLGLFGVWWVARLVQHAAQASFQTSMIPSSTLLGLSWLRNWGEALCHVHPRPDACCW